MRRPSVGWEDIRLLLPTVITEMLQTLVSLRRKSGFFDLLGVSRGGDRTRARVRDRCGRRAPEPSRLLARLGLGRLPVPPTERQVPSVNW